ncbi:MAG: FHA domain-containing protein [Polyangiaceae bacterium]|nr:FHA domain-containing protein [Polyangiaceae bacterium]
MSITIGDREYVLRNERALIGRAPHCRIVIRDPLVSREHALLRVSPMEVQIEDLGSANGVFVNNVRISGLCPLRDGDHILLGTRELRISPAQADAEMGEDTPQPSSRPPSSDEGARRTTERADPLVLLGRLAAHKLSQGLPDQAEQVLESQLMRLLEASRSGSPLGGGVCTSASKHALLLAAALGSARWVDYAVELHLRACRPMEEQILSLLQDALGNVTGIDLPLCAKYVQILREHAALFPEDGERAVAKFAALGLVP